MNYYEEELTPEKTLAIRKKKQKQQTILMALLLIGGGAFYLFVYLNDKRKETKDKIAEIFQNNPAVQPQMLFVKDQVGNLVNNLWPTTEKWEDYLNTLYLPSQLEAFVKKMTSAIERKSQELAEEERERPRKKREAEINACKNFLEEEEKDLPDYQVVLEQFIEKINNTPIDDLSIVSQEFNNLVLEKRYKRKRLYWKLVAHNWADRWLSRSKQSLDGSWDKMKDPITKQEPIYFDARSVYKINFPPTLWNNLTDEQKQLARSNGHNELALRDEVRTYKFSPLIEEWERRTKVNPVRGEYNPNNPNVLDNNALFYGAPRTGKSVMAEKIAYESNKYPLVTIQGSTLTPTKVNETTNVNLSMKFYFTISSITYDLVEDYDFQRAEDGEVKYILFIDEADQVATTNLLPPETASSRLTFLKECMGSDDKKEESKNLWIAATNHLDSINIAVYQSGRLSNPLDFSWTLGIFNYYAERALISHQFPQHWVEKKTLNAEDNKWVNRFNKIIFDKDFLPFWTKFIGNEDTQKELKEIKERNPQGEEIIKQKGIQWGEFFEFFWQLYDSKQLENSNGKWEKSRKPSIEEITEEQNNVMKEVANKLSTDISKSIDTRLNELNQSLREVKNILNTTSTTLNNTISSRLSNLRIIAGGN